MILSTDYPLITLRHVIRMDHMIQSIYMVLYFKALYAKIMK